MIAMMGFGDVDVRLECGELGDVLALTLLIR
jgi:hypothetical protein